MRRAEEVAVAHGKECSLLLRPRDPQGRDELRNETPRRGGLLDYSFRRLGDRGNVSLTGCGWQRLCQSRNRNRGSAIPTDKQVN